MMGVAGLLAWRGGEDALAVSFLLIALSLVSYTSGRSLGLVVTALCIGVAFVVLELELGKVMLFALNGTLVGMLIALFYLARTRAIAGEAGERAATSAREHSDRRFSQMFALSPLPIIVVRSSDRLAVAVNDAFVECFGWTRDELIGQRPLHLNIYSEAAERDALTAAWLRDGSVHNYEIHGQHKNGERRVLLINVENVELEGERHVMTIMNDVTAQRASDERFHKAFEANPLPSAIVRAADRQFLAVNNAFVRMFGYERDVLLSSNSKAIEFSVPEIRARIFDELHRSTSIREREVRMTTKAGVTLDILCSIETVEINGEPALLGVFNDITARKRAEAALRQNEQRLRTITDHIEEVFWMATPDLQVLYVSPAFERVWGRRCEDVYQDPRVWMSGLHPEDRERIIALAKEQRVDTFTMEFRVVRPDGTIRWIHARVFPVLDEHGRLSQNVGFAQDITEQRGLEEQLRQTQKMESLGILAGGVAHDFNNLLAVIASCSGMLAEELPRGTSQYELIEEIENAVNRSAALTRQLLAFSRRQVTEPKVVDINQVVDETRKMLRRMVGEDVILSTSFEPELGHVKIDPGYLVQVLMNLAVNARDAMPRGGSLSITTRNTTLSADAVQFHPAFKNRSAVVLLVSDTGTGMSDTVKHHIFEPFFTTKGQGRGTGMGLAVAHGIVDQAGGFIEVDSAIGEGTTFLVYLPAVDEEVESLHAISGAMALGVESVLVVDDDEYVRRAAARALRTRGYTVTEAADGRAALELLESRTIDLLLTDVVMPNMDGRQLAEAAVAKLPALRVLYTSGYTDDAVVRHGVMEGAVEMIEKPFRIDSLARKVRQVLDKDPAESAARSAKAADRRRELPMASAS